MPLPSSGLRCTNATWFPDGKGFITQAIDETGGSRLYWYDLETKTARRIRDELFSQIARISPDGRELLALDHDRRVGPAVESRRGICWNREGTHFFTFDKGSIPASVFLVDAKTGDETLWLEVHPREGIGVNDVNNVVLTPDGMSYVASYPQTLCALYVMEEVS